MRSGWLWLAGMLAWAGTALGQTRETVEPSSVAGFAFVVGHNNGGPAQEPLQFAERDAARLASALVELGRFSHGGVRLLRSPSTRDVLGGLAALERDRASEAAAGRDLTVPPTCSICRDDADCDLDQVCGVGPVR